MEQLWKINMFNFSKRSINNLKGVHPHLVEVITEALKLTEVDFVVIEGVRSLEDQKKHFSSGSSKTMNSLHLPQQDGYAHAVDLAAYVDGTISWDWKYYEKINEAVQKAATKLHTQITWGGTWKTLRDGPHFELTRGTVGKKETCPTCGQPV